MATKTEDLFVVDTSIAVAWFTPSDQQHSRALEVRRTIRRAPRTFIVPQLFYAELVHVLDRKWRDVGLVRAALDTMVSFGVATLSLAESALLRTPHWARKGLGGYDATFVALAEDVRGRWLTADTNAAKIADEHAVTLLGWSRLRQRES